MDFDVPDGASVLDFLFSNLDSLDEPQEGGTVEFFQLCVLSNQLHPLLDIIRLLLVRLQLARQMRPLLQLVGPFGFVPVHQLDADGAPSPCPHK